MVGNTPLHGNLFRMHLGRWPKKRRRKVACRGRAVWCFEELSEEVVEAEVAETDMAVMDDGTGRGVSELKGKEKVGFGKWEETSSEHACMESEVESVGNGTTEKDKKNISNKGKGIATEDSNNDEYKCMETWETGSWDKVCNFRDLSGDELVRIQTPMKSVGKTEKGIGTEARAGEVGFIRRSANTGGPDDGPNETHGTGLENELTDGMGRGWGQKFVMELDHDAGVRKRARGDAREIDARVAIYERKKVRKSQDEEVVLSEGGEGAGGTNESRVTAGAAGQPCLEK